MLYLVNIDLNLEWPIHVRHYFDSSRVRGDGNSVIFINWEILTGPGDVSTTRDFSEILRSILLIMIFYEILLFILICFIVLEINIHHW